MIFETTQWPNIPLCISDVDLYSLSLVTLFGFLLLILAEGQTFLVTPGPVVPVFLHSCPGW